MSATVVNSLQQVGNTATASIAYTATTGNKLLVTMRSANATVSAPSQLSALTGSPFTDGAGFNYAWIRDVQAGDPTTWAFSGITGTWIVNFVEVSGASSGAPDVFAFVHNAASTTSSTPSITTTQADLCISVFSIAGTNVTFSGETYTQIAAHSQASPAASTLAGQFTQSSAGATSDSVTMNFAPQTGAFAFGFAPASSGSTGTLNETLGAVASAAAANVVVTGSESSTLGAVSVSASGQAVDSASLSITLGGANSTASGAVIDSGALGVTLGGASLTAVGRVIDTGSVARTLGGVSVNASGQAIESATLSQGLGAVSLSATGTSSASVSSDILLIKTSLSKALSVSTALSKAVSVNTKLSKSITLNTTLR